MFRTNRGVHYLFHFKAEGPYIRKNIKHPDTRWHFGTKKMFFLPTRKCYTDGLLR
jgi:hypothetical protein